MVQLRILHQLQLKIKYLRSIVQFKKTGYNIKITEIEKKLTDHDLDKYITTIEFNNLVPRVFPTRLAQVNLVAKTDIDDKLRILDQKVTSNKRKHLFIENELKKLQTFDSIYFRGKILKKMVHKIIQYFN